MGMRFSLSPWPRKRGEPALDVVDSPPGIGLSEPPGGKKFVNEGGDRSISEVVVAYVGISGSVWEKESICEKRNMLKYDLKRNGMRC